MLTDIEMLLIIEKRIWGEICHAIHHYTKANNKYTKTFNQNKESLYFMYLDADNLHGWAMSQKLPVCNFNWEKAH